MTGGKVDVEFESVPTIAVQGLVEAFRSPKIKRPSPPATFGAQS